MQHLAYKVTQLFEIYFFKRFNWFSRRPIKNGTKNSFNHMKAGLEYGKKNKRILRLSYAYLSLKMWK